MTARADALAVDRPAIDFQLPTGSDATEPPEQRGAGRDDVRLLVARAGAQPVVRHRRFRDLPDELKAGDLLVVNTSGTLPAAVDALLADGTSVVVHVSTDLDDGTWIVEVRRLDGRGPRRDLGPGTRLHLPGWQWLTLDEAYPDRATPTPRLWRSHPAERISSMVSASSTLSKSRPCSFLIFARTRYSA